MDQAEGRINDIHVKPMLQCRLNSLPNDKFLDWSKLNAFADDKINFKLKTKFLGGCEKTLRGKEKMLVTSIFSFCHYVFKKLLFQGRQKSGLCGKGLMNM